MIFVSGSAFLRNLLGLLCYYHVTVFIVCSFLLCVSNRLSVFVDHMPFFLLDFST